MKNWIWILIISLLLGIGLNAQGISWGFKVGLNYSGLKDYNDYIESYHYNRIGMGLEFGITGQYFINPQLILRGDATLYATSSKRDNEKVITVDDTYYYVTNKYTFLAFPLFINLLYMINPDGKGRFYFGGGPGIIPVSITYNAKFKNDATDTSYTEESKGSDNTTCLGFQILGGYEYFVNRKQNISILGEILIRMSNLKFNDGTEEKSAGFNSFGIIFGFNYYFMK